MAFGGILWATMMTKTDTTMYHGRRSWYVAGLAVSFVTLLVSSYFASKHQLFGWERSSFTFINDWPDSLTTLFKVISISQQALVLGAIAVAATFFLRQWRLTWRMAASVFGGAALAFLLKHVIDRARPEGLMHDVHIRWVDSGAGFPSGHVTIATIVLLTILPYLPSRWRWTAPTGIILMCLSRVYLGVHAPLDIIGGLAIGLFVVCFIRVMPQPLRVFFKLD